MTEPGSLADQLADALAATSPATDRTSMLPLDEVEGLADDMSDFLLGILDD